MPAFYFDVGGVLIPDNFSPENALKTFEQLRQPGVDPADAYAIYQRLQPAFDLGRISFGELSIELGADENQLGKDWLAMHPVDPGAIGVIERLLAAGHSVGLATNFCRTLLNMLIESAPVLSRLVVCCSSDIGLVKPEQEFFHHASTLLPAGETVFVDDREINVRAARKFGWTAIRATPGWVGEFEKAYVP
ncbi:MAG: HAD-IA family hydrolase [Acidobacteria bacterium]|nr:HAD-IA family hydrolase [Acidobacteriota bacterium]